MKQNSFINRTKIILALAGLVSLTANAGLGPPPSPPDINFAVAQLDEADLPITIAAGRDLIEVGGAGSFGVKLGAGAAEEDDGYELLDVSSVFNMGFDFYGTNYSGVGDFAISSNGYVMFDDGSGNFDASAIISPEYLAAPVSNTPFFLVHTGDMSTYDQATFEPSAGGTSTGTNDVFYHLDASEKVVTITYDDVGMCCDYITSEQLTAAQVRFHSLGHGDFVVEHRYEQIGWAKEREMLGWSDGAGVNYDNDFTAKNYATDSNIGHPGVYAWWFVNGEVVNNGRQDTVESKAPTGTAVGRLVLSNVDYYSGPPVPRAIVSSPVSYALLDDAGGRFALNVVDGTASVVVADGTKLDYEVDSAHNIVVEVSYGVDQTFSKTLTINVVRAGFFVDSEGVGAGGLNWLVLFVFVGLLIRRRVS